MKKFVVINDELRLGDVDDIKDLIGENTDSVKMSGTWEIDKKNNNVFFYGEEKPSDVGILKHIKKEGFYSPLILGYNWLVSDLNVPSAHYLV